MTEKLSKTFLKRKTKIVLTREQLSLLDKNELIDKIISLDAQNTQLKNIINKTTGTSNVVPTNVKKREFDFSKCYYRKIFLQISYFGWDYHGYVVQDDSPNTIENHLFQALIKACLIESREKANYNRCGRTDRGVSSYGQVISITVRSRHPPSDQNHPSALSVELPYCKMLNRLLPKQIRAITWLPLPDDHLRLSARFDCKLRQYKYYFPKSTLDLKAMTEACGQLIGVHDFRNFCKMDVGNGVMVHMREVFSACIVPFNEKDTDERTSMYVFVIEGNAFLWHQIRCIMSILLLVGQGLESPGIVQYLLDVDGNPRKPQYNIALDTPLNFNKCTYDIEDLWVYDEYEIKNVIINAQKLWTEYNVKTTIIRDFIRNLEGMYEKFVEGPTDDSIYVKSDKVVSAYIDSLLQGSKAKVYKPLMKRQLCSSIENRIDHYTKKQKLTPVEDADVEMKT
ncbi:tRNA pseudouridine(38/39) synthase [Vanessa atalanta]|uniref:tRNA pseudouridine(38/39) synthase n=1 Tax=Vanessa atalanta TaxID=42275 RepID=UPI001FCD88BB|nr:tRNA pseudouridine(38/39) synthase [Vanessa atalanta]